MGPPGVQSDVATTAEDSGRPVRTKKSANAKGGSPRTSSPASAAFAAANGSRALRGGDVDPVGAPASKRVLRTQGRRTMRKLLDATMVAFEERGYHNTRVNDVVEIAKTSHGTFYLY